MVPEIKEIIIIGGGKSVSDGISLGLKDKIKDKFVIVCNFSFFHFDHTLLTCCDREFYRSTNLARHPDIYERLKEEPLIISTMKPKANLIIHPNTILLKRNANYSDNPLRDGFLTFLTGIFSLQLALLFEPENLFLCGFDYGQLNPKDKKITQTKEDIHYYGKKILHRGSGLVSYYNHNDPDRFFKHFNNSKSKIFNVSPQSAIQNFEKVDYPTMFNLMSDVRYNQMELRQQIKDKLTN